MSSIITNEIEDVSPQERTEKSVELKQLIEDIYNLNVCGEDQCKVKRDIECINLDADVMLVSEALAPMTGRVSGVPYFYPNGCLGNTGKSLEKFIEQFNRTLYPGYSNTIYSTEVVNDFPGYIETKRGTTIRKPSKEEIDRSLSSCILEREISVMSPKVILLMGNTAYRSFYKHFLGRNRLNNLTAEIDDITRSKHFISYHDIPIILIQHSSGSNPRFNSMLENKELIELINRILD